MNFERLGFGVTLFIALAQGFFFIFGGLYFLNMVLAGRDERKGIKEEDKRESERLNQLEKITVGEPLTERVRPTNFDEIIGQKQAIKALKVALCGKRPQHILIYGPPGVGKTAAARVALEEAKRSSDSAFSKDAKFIEIDATTLRYDERSFADPLIGSVHDPIYQGAGAYGPAGIPQPKQGAVSDAHGGVLFIDEIGELAPMQLNKLLKVLEDRRVYFESAYYSRANKNIPHYIHNIFRYGIPADFRLIGATTRRPSEIPAALRSRCTEIFFLPLGYNQVMEIAKNAAVKLDISVDKEAAELLCSYVSNGRDCVRVLETLANLIKSEARNRVTKKDVMWGVRSSRIEKRKCDIMPSAQVAKIKEKKQEREKVLNIDDYLK